jgi:uncharacterized protein (TIGR03118 family)
MAFRAAVCFWGLFVALALGISTPAQEAVQTNLVSDQAGVATNQDILLINAYGLARGTGTDWMVAANGSAQGIVYDGFGNAQFINVNTPAASNGAQGQPTGVVFNGSASFNLPGTQMPAQFLFATADGLIEAFNSNVDGANAFVAVNNSASASYTGLTIVEVSPGVFHLLAANFKQGRVDVFDGNFQPLKQTPPITQIPGPFGAIFSPYNVQTVGRDVVVTYAKRGTNGQANATGGLAIIFDVRDHVVSFLNPISLNAPWGIAQAPADFGRLSHAVLIGNNGSGKVSAFDPFSGRFISFVEDSTGNPIVIDGLRALGFGATGAAGDPSFANQQSGAFNALYFSAGPVGGTHGLLGNLVPLFADFVLGEQ